MISGIMGSGLGDYRKLDVWEAAHGLTLAIYRATSVFPASERFGITSQLRRAAASVAANIAEGCGRNSDAELARFLRISLGSASEVEYFLLLEKDAGNLGETEWKAFTDELDSVKSRLARLNADSSQPTDS